jgi:3D (Asp-Asp-Asp) domain-containing protein
MRIMSTTVAAIVLGMLITIPSVSADTISTQTNTNITNEISSLSIQNDPFLLAMSTFNTTPETLPKKPPEEIQRENTLAQWKIKQAPLWNALPKEPFTINASAYTAAADECGKSDGITASGLPVREKETLACPPNYPFGTKIAIEGYGMYTCEDRGGAIKNNHFDIYIKTKHDAFAFGRRQLMAKIVE